MTDTDNPATGPDSYPTTPVKTTPLNTPPLKTTPLKTPSQSTTPTPTDALPRRRPLFPTILWGAMMLALAAYFAAGELLPDGFDPLTWFLTAVVGVGLLLVVAGIAAATRRAG